jgi:DNA invertase Pin-like site-specific DNA recombinase
MTRSKNGYAPSAKAAIRCAVYTRKSTEEGLEQEFNSLDPQREAGEAFIKSQAHEGWTCLPDRYDDGGFTGGNMERPALQRLLADIEAGKIDAVVVYKVDRLSRFTFGLRPDDGDVRQAPRFLRLGHAAVQLGNQHGPTGAERATLVRPV